METKPKPTTWNSKAVYMDNNGFIRYEDTCEIAHGHPGNDYAYKCMHETLKSFAQPPRRRNYETEYDF